MMDLLKSPAAAAWFNLINLIALIGTLTGVVLAVKALRDGKGLLAKTAELQGQIEQSVKTSTLLVDGLQKVSESLTTHRVGESPGYVESITALVKTARESVEITAILPGVGYFSFPQGWVGLSNALLERQQSAVRVSLLVGTRESRRADHYVRFAEARSDWSKFANEPKNVALLELFSRRYHRTTTQFETAKEFEEFCLDVDEKIIDEIFALAEVRTTNHFIPVVRQKNSWVSGGSGNLASV